MLDKNQARKLAPMVKNKKEWAVLLEYLNHLKTLELQEMFCLSAIKRSEIISFRGKPRIAIPDLSFLPT